MATTTVAINLEAKTSGTESIKSLKTQLSEASNEAISLAQKFGEFSPEATKAAQKVADLKEELGNVQKNIQTLGLNKFQQFQTIAKSVAHGFEAAHGAMALFGAESEDVQKALLKVQGAMAFAQGLEGLSEAGKELKSLGTKGIEAFKGMTSASKAFMLTGIGLILTAIAAVVAYWDEIKVAISGVSAEQKKLNEETQKNLETNQKQLDVLNKSDNILKLQGKSENEIRQMKLDQLKLAIANAETSVKNAKITRDAQIEAAKRNKDILKGIINFLYKPLQLIIDAVTKVANFLGADWKFNLGETIAGAIFDPEETAKEGDKVIAEAEATLLDLKNQQAGILLSMQKQNQEAATKGTETVNKIAEDRARADAEYAQQTAKTLKERIDAFEMAWALEVKGEAKKNLTKEQLKREHDLKVKTIQEKFDEEQKAAQEKAAAEEKARKEKEAADAIKATDEYYKKQQAALVGNNEALAQLEVQRLEAQITNAQKYGQSTVELELQLAQKKKEIYDADKKAKEESEKAKREAQMATLTEAANAIGALGGILKEGSDAAKAAALLDIAIKTGVGFAQGLSIAQKGAEGTGPAAPYAFPIFYAQQVAAVLGAMSRAKAILKGGSGGGGGGGGMGAAGTAPAPAIPLTGGGLPQEGQFGGMGRVYVLEGDITKTQTRVRRLRNTSVV
jgi:hypothetical protein